jgi:hypothetical protein
MVAYMSGVKEELVQLIRLALGERAEDVRLYVARLVRKYRKEDPELAVQLDDYLRDSPARSIGALRKSGDGLLRPNALPLDDESRLPLLKVFRDSPSMVKPILAQPLDDAIEQLVSERSEGEKLAAAGLTPPRSAIFLGEPGVGKTLTARWIASRLGLPLYVLDLTAVMSSLLGKTGANIRAALDFAKNTDCVLMLDEIDAIAKRRSDDSDIGELKRLVTVILQEVDSWPSTSLLLAATNYSEMIDPALWRRFDVILHFFTPDIELTKAAVVRFLDADRDKFSRWIDVLSICLYGETYSDIERSIRQFRRSVVLKRNTEEALVRNIIIEKSKSISRQQKIEIASMLSRETALSQHAISNITGVSRDTIRKYATSKV